MTTKTKDAPRAAQHETPARATATTTTAAATIEKPHRRETGPQRLVKIANARVGRALRAIHLVGNIGGYQPSAEQSFAILSALQQAVKDAETRLKNEGKVVFQLPMAG
jgi:hypothetical protein